MDHDLTQAAERQVGVRHRFALRAFVIARSHRSWAANTSSNRAADDRTSSTRASQSRVGTRLDVGVAAGDASLVLGDDLAPPGRLEDPHEAVGVAGDVGEHVARASSPAAGSAAPGRHPVRPSSPRDGR